MSLRKSFEAIALQQTVQKGSDATPVFTRIFILNQIVKVFHIWALSVEKHLF